MSYLFPLRAHKQFVPQESGQHRQAVIALYRALLRQCTATPSTEDERDGLKNTIRNRFRANRHLRAPRRLKLSFYAGYKALDHLDGFVAGDAASARRVTSYFLQIPDYLKQPPVVEVRQRPNDPPYVTPPERQFFNVFPRPTVEGIRKVPFFVRANGFPMVRWKKPQPSRLSRTIRQLNEQKQKSIDHIHMFENYYLPLAQYEDDWDALMSDDFGVTAEREISWARNVREVHSEMKSLSIQRHERTIAKAHKMIEIVEKEQELADKEQAEREGSRHGQAIP